VYNEFRWIAEYSHIVKKFPKAIRDEISICEFRGRVATQRPLLEYLFDSVTNVRNKVESFSATVQADPDYFFEKIVDGDKSVQEMASRASENWNNYEDVGSALIMIASASLERLHSALGESLLNRGYRSYVDEVYFSQAVMAIRNQIFHFGEWRDSKSSRGDKDRERLKRLIDDPLRGDAASEFLKRSKFNEYLQFQEALLSCAEGLVPDRDRIMDRS